MIILSETDFVECSYDWFKHFAVRTELKIMLELFKAEWQVVAESTHSFF